MPSKFQQLAVRSNGGRGDYNYRGAGFRKSGFFKYNSTYGSSAYIHMLTNIPNGKRAWYTVEAVGYNYGLAQDIYCLWSFKPHAINNGGKGSATPRAEGLRSNYDSSEGIFASNAGYIELVGYASSFYYIGFALNVFAATDPEADLGDPADPYAIPDVQITATALNQSGGQNY